MATTAKPAGKVAFKDLVSNEEPTLFNTASEKRFTDADCSENDKIAEDEQCALGPIAMDCIQSLATPLSVLLCMSTLVLTQSLLVTGYTNSILTTIEKRYNLMSSEIGLIVSSYDITCIITGIIVSYYGDSYSVCRPRWLGRGALIMALGSFLFALPYFFSDTYDPSKYFNTNSLGNQTAFDANLCNNTAVNNDQPCHGSQISNPRWQLILFILAKLTLGVGTAPIFILGPTYLYDNVDPKNYSVYAGIMYSMGALGPAVGFLMGAMCLTLFEDPGREPLGLTSHHTAWVGAWWLGFLVSSVLSVIVAIPLLMFPKRLPGASKESLCEGQPNTMTLSISIRDMPKKFASLFMNWIWIRVSFVLLMEESLSTGYVTFIAKYFQLTFAIPPSSANVLTGTIIIPGAFIGIIAGGIMMRHVESLQRTVQLLLWLNILPICCLSGMMFLTCNNINLAGITTAYSYLDLQEDVTMKGNAHIHYKGNLTSYCNTACACSKSVYEPVCGDDQVTYYSPCHAGCTKLDIHTTQDGLLVRNYTQCSCIYENFIHMAHPGTCKQDCYNLAPFLVLLFFAISLTCCGQNPALLVTLGCVDSSLKSFALGMQFVVIRLFAFVPAPVYFGKIFDSQCLLWTSSCNGTGSCLEYDRQILSYLLFGTGVAIKLLGYGVMFSIYVTSSAETKAVQLRGGPNCPKELQVLPSRTECPKPQLQSPETTSEESKPKTS